MQNYNVTVHVGAELEGPHDSDARSGAPDPASKSCVAVGYYCLHYTLVLVLCAVYTLVLLYCALHLGTTTVLVLCVVCASFDTTLRY